MTQRTSIQKFQAVVVAVPKASFSAAPDTVYPRTVYAMVSQTVRMLVMRKIVGVVSSDGVTIIKYTIAWV